MSGAERVDIAIVGMGWRSPAAPDLCAYWEDLLAGRHAPAASVAGEAPALSDVIAAALADAGRNPDGMGEPPSCVTLDAAVRTLSAGETDLAIVAGADGASRAAAALIVRRRADAERDGDRVYAVVRDRPAPDEPAPGRAVDADGLAGLIQAALALHHRVRPPDLTAVRPWIHAEPAIPRRVGVRASGPAVLEEHAATADADFTSARPGAMLHWETEVVLLSAPDRAALADRARELAGWLEDRPGAILKDVAYTLNQPDRREAGSVRLGMVATTASDLAGRLTALLPRLEDPARRPIVDGRGIYLRGEPLAEAGGLAFLFPGEGSQYPGMLGDLCVHFPEVRGLFDTSDRIAFEQGDAVPPSEYLFGGAGESDDRRALWSTSTAVNVVLSAQWALYQVLTRLGLRPDAVAGHSSGELLALAAAGVFDIGRHLEREFAGLGMVFHAFETAGDLPSARLAAIAAGRERVEAACRAVDASKAVVAMDNCPHQVVLAGPPDEVERVARRLRAENVLLEDLPFQRAYHTPDFGAVLGPLAAFFNRLSLRVPRIPVYSCATRRPMPADPEAIRELAIAQWTRTVAFRETIEAMHADGLRIFVDVGARGNLAGFVQDTLRGRTAFAIATNLPRRSGLTQLNHLVAALFAHGVSIDPSFLYARRRPRRIDLPMADGGVSVGWAPPTDADLGGRDGLCIDRSPADEPECTPASSIADRFPTAPCPLPHAPRSTFGAGDLEPLLVSDVAATMLAFQETMRAFLEAQQAVLGAYLGSSSGRLGYGLALDEASAESCDGGPCPPDRETTSGPEPGPWVGEIRHLVPGLEVDSAFVLDAQSDPIAEHHTLGSRRVSALDPTLKGLPVLPFAVMAEMAAQAAAMVVPPGLVLVRLGQVCAHKWVRYEDEPVVLELRGRREPSSEPGEHRVRVELINRGTNGRTPPHRPVFEAVAVFADSTPEPPGASSWSLDDPRPSRFSADSLYGEQWLFHGPAFQAVVQVGDCTDGGIDGVLRVLPCEPLLPPGTPARLHTDLIVLDSFTHLLGCWGLDYLADRGDVVFPLRMEELQLFGDRPPVGTDVACRIAIEEIQRHRVRVSAEIVRPDGTLWMRLCDWEDWRFHWPGRYRDVFRQPQDVFIGEEWTPTGADPSMRAVWLAPPADMGRPVWRDVLEFNQLGPAERAGHLAIGGSEDARSRRLWGRIAAKEAARRLWRDEGRASTYPADLAIVEERSGRPILIRLDDPGDRSLPAVAIGEAEGAAVAIAVRDSRSRPGVGVAAVGEARDEPALAPGELALLARWDGALRLEWAARFRSARDAARSAMGSRPAAEVVRIDESTGVVQVRLAAAGALTVRVTTGRRGDHCWAWTPGDGVEL